MFLISHCIIHHCLSFFIFHHSQLSVPQTEYTLGGTNKMGSHVYFQLIVAMVLLLWRHIVLLWRPDNISIKHSTIWQNNSISQKTCNRKYTWLPVLLLPPGGHSIWGTENCLSLSIHCHSSLSTIQHCLSFPTVIHFLLFVISLCVSFYIAWHSAVSVIHHCLTFTTVCHSPFVCHSPLSVIHYYLTFTIVCHSLLSHGQLSVVHYCLSFTII